MTIMFVGMDFKGLVELFKGHFVDKTSFALVIYDHVMYYRIG